MNYMADVKVTTQTSFEFGGNKIKIAETPKVAVVEINGKQLRLTVAELTGLIQALNKHEAKR